MAVLQVPFLNASAALMLARLVLLALLAAVIGLASWYAPTFAAESPSVAPAAAWMQTNRETGLWSGSDDKAMEFVKVSEGTMVQALETRGRRTYVYFGGDGKSKGPGEVWIETADLRASGWPRWIRARRATKLLLDRDSNEGIVLSRGSWIETLSAGTGVWARAFYLGDGRAVQPMEGWVAASDFALSPIPQERITSAMLDRLTYASLRPEVWHRVPYRSQLDGSRYADANCGPTSVGMALEAFGVARPLGALRTAVLDLQGMSDCDECGVFIQHLATVAETNGMPTLGLRRDDGEFRQWTLDEVRAQLRAGRLVIPQVRYRRLPGRATSQYWGDHYIVVAGISGDRFIYNDPVDSDGNGFGRIMTGEALAVAMDNSNNPNAAFAIGR